MAGGSHMALDIRIAGRYRLGRKIGSGSFGDIYLGTAFRFVSRPFGLYVPRCPKRSWRKMMISLSFSCVTTLLPLAGTHIQTGEEVGIKLVCEWICLELEVPC